MAEWDVFISHASEDKAEVVEPLVKRLKAESLNVWFDKHQLKLGDSLSRKIDEGLSKSSFGIVLSPSFFAKNWPQRELDGLTSRESGGHKVILPIWHQVEHDAIERFSSMLAAKLAVKISQGLDEVVRQILDVIRPADVAVPPKEPSPVTADFGGTGNRSSPSRRGWLLGLALIPLLAGGGWLGYQELVAQAAKSSGLERDKPMVEPSKTQAGDPVVVPQQAPAPEASGGSAIQPEPIAKPAAYERALQLPGVEKVPGKQGGGSLEMVLDLGDGQKLTLLWVEPGEFLMGGPTTEVGREEREPLHKVFLSKDYFLGQTEVTQGQWRAVMRTEPWEGERLVQEGALVAASHITYDEAMEFCKRLNESQQSGQRPPAGWVFGLPSEAQWEFACRAGTKTAYCSGGAEQDLARVAVYSSNREGEYAHPVRTKAANDWGFFDMHGNVWEWAADAWSEGKVIRDGEGDPLVAGPTFAARIVRGGSWDDVPGRCRSAVRDWREPGLRVWVLGFRLCLLSGPGAPRRQNERKPGGEAVSRARAAASEPVRSACPRNRR